MQTQFRLIGVVVALGSFLLIRPDANGADNSPPPDPDAAIKATAAKLASDDPQEVEQALTALRQRYASDPRQTASSQEGPITAALWQAHKYDEVAGFSLTATLYCLDDLERLRVFQTTRVRALISAGRGEEALRAAKSLYNACRLVDTSAAVDLVAQALVLARRGDPGMVKKFKLEQLYGANTNLALDARVKWPSLLAAVKIDPTPYQPVIDKRLQAGKPTTATRLDLGTLYLLAGEPLKAEGVFRQCQSTDKKEAAAITEGIARAIRAEDGTIGRADAWLVTERLKLAEANAPGDYSLASLAVAPTPLYSSAPNVAAFKVDEPVLDADRIPQHPVTLARGYPATERKLLTWLKHWAEDIDLGVEHSVESGAELPGLVKVTALKCLELHEIARGIEFVDGPTNALPFLMGAVDRGELEIQGHVAGDPRDAPVLRALLRMSAFVQTRDFDTQARILHLVANHAPTNSPLAWRCGFLEGQALGNSRPTQGSTAYLPAAKLYENLLARDEVQKWPQADRNQLHWAAAYALFKANKFPEAIPHFEELEKLGKQSYSSWAQQLHLLSLAFTGRADEAQPLLADWLANGKPTPTMAAYVSDLINNPRLQGNRVVARRPAHLADSVVEKVKLTSAGPQGISLITLAAPGSITNVFQRRREISPQRTMLWQESYWVSNGCVHLLQEDLPNPKGYLFVDDLPAENWARATPAFELIKTPATSCYRIRPLAASERWLERQLADLLVRHPELPAMEPDRTGAWRQGGERILSAYELTIEPELLRALTVEDTRLLSNRVSLTVGQWQDGSSVGWECVFDPATRQRLSERVVNEKQVIREQIWQLNAVTNSSQFTPPCQAGNGARP